MTLHQYLMLAVMALVVIILRAVPFMLFAGKRRVPEVLLYLGNVLTAAAIAMLVVYSMYGNLNYNDCGLKNLLPALLAGSLTVILHWFIKNPLISIISGTVCYMLLI